MAGIAAGIGIADRGRVEVAADGVVVAGAVVDTTDEAEGMAATEVATVDASNQDRQVFRPRATAAFPFCAWPPKNSVHLVRRIPAKTMIRHSLVR